MHRSSSRRVRPSRAFSFRYVFLAEPRRRSSRIRSYARNDLRRRDHIMRINHSDKRQPLLPILLPQNCALILRVSYNKSDHHYCYFCLAAVCSGFLNYALPPSPPPTPNKPGAPCTVTQRKVTPRCCNKGAMIVPTIVSLRVTAVRMFLHGRSVDVDLIYISRRTSL